MTKKTPSNTLIWFTVAAIALLFAGTGAAWLTLSSLESRLSQTPKTESVPSNPTSQSTQPQLTPGEAQVYWLFVEGNETKWVTRTLVGTKSLNKNQALQMALEQLLTQTPNPPASSAIPPGTRLLSIKSNDQGIYLNLSQAFTEGGGSESMKGRLGQVIYTATSLNPQASVWISVEGKPLENLGGEGLIVAQPINRQIFEDDF